MEQNTGLIFTPGLYLEKPKDNAPKSIKLTASIKVEDFITFLQVNKNARGYVNLDLRKSEEKGTFYATLNTFKADMAAPKKEGFVADVAGPSTDGRSNFDMEQEWNATMAKDVPF